MLWSAPPQQSSSSSQHPISSLLSGGDGGKFGAQVGAAGLNWDDPNYNSDTDAMTVITWTKDASDDDEAKGKDKDVGGKACGCLGIVEGNVS